MGNNYLIFYLSTNIISYLLLCISFTLGCFRFSRFNKEERWYLFFLGFIFIIVSITTLLMLLGINNMFAYSLYITGEFVFLSVMFITGLKLSRKFFIGVGIAAAYILTESMVLWLTGKNSTSGIGKIVSHLSIICLSGYYMVWVLKGYQWENHRNFLIITAFLFLYYTVSLFLFILMEQLSIISKDNASIIWGINNILSSVLYGSSIYTFIQLKR